MRRALSGMTVVIERQRFFSTTAGKPENWTTAAVPSTSTSSSTSTSTSSSTSSVWPRAAEENEKVAKRRIGATVGRTLTETDEGRRPPSYRPQFREILYEHGELDASDLEKPPSSTNPHPFVPDPNLMPPTHAASLVPFANHSPALQALLKMGVSLFQVEKEYPRLGQELVRLDVERDIRPRVDILVQDVGLSPAEIGEYLTRNPSLLVQSLDDIKVRLRYLQSKGFSSKDVKKIVVECRFWLNMSVSRQDARLRWLINQFSLKDGQLRELIVKEPRLLIFGTGPVQRVALLANQEWELQPAEVQKLLMDDPRVFMISAPMLRQQWLLVRFRLKFSRAQVLEHPLVLRCAYHVLRQRHLFLAKLGRGDKFASATELEKMDEKERDDRVPIQLFLHESDTVFVKEAARSFMAVYEDFLRVV